MGKEIGKIKRIFIQRGYLFIRAEKSDIFAAFRDCQDWEFFSSGLLVEYDLEDCPDGRKRAVNVRELKLDAK